MDFGGVLFFWLFCFFEFKYFSVSTLFVLREINYSDPNLFYSYRNVVRLFLFRIIKYIAK